MGTLNSFMNEINWIVSLLVAIPLSIASNLLTPKFENWRAGKSRKAALTRLQVVQQELEEATHFASNPAHLNTFLIANLLTVIVLFALPNVFSGLTGALHALPVATRLYPEPILNLMTAGTAMLNALFNLMAIMRATRAATVYKRVERFESYQRETKALIAELNARAA